MNLIVASRSACNPTFAWCALLDSAGGDDAKGLTLALPPDGGFGYNRLRRWQLGSHDFSALRRKNAHTPGVFHRERQRADPVFPTLQDFSTAFWVQR